MSVYTELIGDLVAGRPLTVGAAERLMSAIMEGQLDQPQVAATLTAIAVRGATADEMTGFARIMRRHMIVVQPPSPAFDPCGTGGSGLPTANTSTLVAFVLAAAGVRVAKHGNRASSGKCGSMDVLEALGVHIELSPEQVAEVTRSSPVVFMYARRHHPALGQVTPVRRVLGFPTVFNYLGPICNPAHASRQLMGVSSLRMAELLIHALRALGTERAATVCGQDGLDEISLACPTHMWHLHNGVVEPMLLRPELFGMETLPMSLWQGGGVEENKAIFLQVLTGRDEGPHTLHTALNAGAALWLAGAAETIGDGIDLARQTLSSGRAWAAFEDYRDLSRSFSP